MISAPTNLFVQLSCNSNSFLKVTIYLSKPRLASLSSDNGDDKMLGRNWLHIRLSGGYVVIL
jgi:hypothetical protein